MARNKNNNQNFLSKCSACGSEFEEEGASLVEEQEKRTIFHATCRKCQMSTLIFISNTQTGIISLGLATDLDGSEAKQKFLKNSISADEVIDAYKFVSGSVGNLDDFLNSKR